MTQTAACLRSGLEKAQLISGLGYASNVAVSDPKTRPEFLTEHVSLSGQLKDTKEQTITAKSDDDGGSEWAGCGWMVSGWE